MQWKMVRPSRLSDAFNHWALRHGFPLLLRIAPRLPRWVDHLGAVLVIRAVMGLYRRPRLAIARNLSRILGAPPGSRRIRREVRRMLHAFSIAWVDLFRLAPGPAGAAMREVEAIEGREHLDAALASGRGVLLLTAHLGPWELGGVFLRQIGVRLAVVYVPDAFVDVENARRELRRAAGIDAIAIHPEDRFASLPVLRALREGRVVALQGDRDFNDRGERVPFFGAPAPLPTGPFHLAAMTGAALVPSFVVYGEARRFRLVVGEPIEIAAAGARADAVRAALEEWSRVLERAVRRWPTQWFTFYDFWTGGDAGDAAPGGRAA